MHKQDKSILKFIFFLVCTGLNTAQAQEIALDYLVGKSIFEKVWVSAPASTNSSDGLGPLYNARSCAQCHPNGGAGKIENSLVVMIDDEYFGEQLQRFAVPGLSAEASTTITYTDVSSANGFLKRPNLQFNHSAISNSELEAYSVRLASSLSGIGLIEQISEQQILDLVDQNDEDGDGISGKANWVWDIRNQKEVLGRFGWKASQPNVEQQTAKALSLDIGISSELFPDAFGDCSQRQTQCRSMPTGATLAHDGFEASRSIMRTLLKYLYNIPAPLTTKTGITRDDDLAVGESIFNELGCSACHHPQFSLADSTISPYSDFLLHDMGAGLADNLEEELAAGAEWRTAPLWGVSEKATALLHDGRASNLEEAILWHEGEAQNAKQLFVSLTQIKKAALIRFLNSL